jgi:hypothetical protein
MDNAKSFINWGFNNYNKGIDFYTVSEIRYWDEEIDSLVKVIPEIDNIANRQVNNYLAEAKGAIDQIRRIAININDLIGDMGGNHLPLIENCEQSMEKLQELITLSWKGKKEKFPEGIRIEIGGWDFDPPYRIRVNVVLLWDSDKICFINIMDNETEGGLPSVDRLEIIKRPYKNLQKP